MTLSTKNWLPTASFENLRARSTIIKLIRDFFNERGVLEVETPLLCHTSVTDPFIQSIPAFINTHANNKEQQFYLQTSPEYAMKRLLAAGSGAIFQICKAFRQGDIGKIHNPEFTILEWYRIDYDHHQLMDEMDELLRLILKTSPAERITYKELFLSRLQVNPHTATLSDLKACARKNNITIINNEIDRDTWLDLLRTHVIEPTLGQHQPVFIYDFPASQAALARIQTTNPPVASRFEVYFQGIELANGFHELQDVNEQRKRFEKNLVERTKLQLNILPIDELFLSALSHGLPDCAGVALGIDRLIMLAGNKNKLADVLSFDITRV